MSMANANTCSVVRVDSTNPKAQGPFVEINASDFDPARHTLYIEPPPLTTPVVLPPPPAAPAPVNVLANLPKDWRDRKTSWLREMAEKACGGRTPETREQAIQTIEATLAGKV